MRTVWALMDPLQTIAGGIYNTHEDAQAALDGLGPLGCLYDIGEIDYDDTPPDEVTDALKNELQREYRERNIVNLHLSKGPKFYAMPINERLEFVLKLVRGEFLEGARDIDLNDERAPTSKVEQIDVAEYVKSLPSDGIGD